MVTLTSPQVDSNINKVQKRSDAHIAEIALFLSGALYGASTPVGKELGHWMTPASIVMTRFFVAALICGVYMRRSTRTIERSLLHLIPLGIYYALAASFFTHAFFRSSIGIAIFGYYLANLLSSMVIGVTVHREPIDRATVVSFIASLAAVAAISLARIDNSSGNDALLGLLYGGISGILATVIYHEQKRHSKSFDNEIITFAQLLIGGLCVIPVVLFAGDSSVTNLSTGGFALVILYGLMFFGCNWLSVYGFRHGPLGLGTILLSVEVAVGPAMAWVFFDEHLNTLEIIGGLLTSIAVISTARRKR